MHPNPHISGKEVAWEIPSDGQTGSSHSHSSVFAHLFILDTLLAIAPFALSLPPEWSWQLFICHRGCRMSLLSLPSEAHKNGVSSSPFPLRGYVPNWKGLIKCNTGGGKKINQKAANHIYLSECLSYFTLILQPSLNDPFPPFSYFLLCSALNFLWKAMPCYSFSHSHLHCEFVHFSFHPQSRVSTHSLLPLPPPSVPSTALRDQQQLPAINQLNATAPSKAGNYWWTSWNSLFGVTDCSAAPAQGAPHNNSEAARHLSPPFTRGFVSVKCLLDS